MFKRLYQYFVPPSSPKDESKESEKESEKEKESEPSIQPELVDCDGDDLIPPFHIPYLFTLDLKKIQKVRDNWHRTPDAFDAKDVERYREYPRFQAGLFGTLQPIDVAPVPQ